MWKATAKDLSVNENRKDVFCGESWGKLMKAIAKNLVVGGRLTVENATVEGDSNKSVCAR